MKWTAEQSQSITTTDRSLLVSAAAGSGKTAVLAERCAHLVCDAKERCDIDELLVVTFTKAAAAEMRIRIEQALRKRMQNSNDPRLGKQLMLLDRAQINTLHGFCQSVLRRHFHVLGLDPNFRVLDEEQTWLLKLEIARDLLDQRYETDTSGDFQKLIDQYGNGDDQTILRRIISLHELMGSVVDPDGWLKAAGKKIAEAKNAKPLIRSEFGMDLAANVRRWIADLRGRWVRLATQVSQIEGLEPYGEYINDLLAAIESWQQTFAKGNFDALAAEIIQFDPGPLPRFKNPPPEKEQIQAAIEAIRKEMRDGSITEFCRFSEEQWRAGLTAIYAPSRVFVDLVREFGKRFQQAKQELGGLDFTDLERFALQILRKTSAGTDLSPSAIARSYHKLFKHVLVDEYQDINEVQDAILHLVSRESVCGEHDAGKMNLFCVGDVKQSIYRFRLAKPEQFLDRYKKFKAVPADPGPSAAGTVIDLSANFRSKGPLINVINSVFERLMTSDAVGIEYNESHKLKAAALYPPPDGRSVFAGAPVELHLLAPGTATDEEEDLDRTEREACFVARRLTELMSQKIHVADKGDDGLMLLRPLRYRDIVILLRSMKYKSRQFADILRGAGIPVHTDSGSGFFDSMEIRDMLSLLRLLDNQQQDVPMAAVLRSPLSGLAQPDDCLARIRLSYPDSDQVPFHQAVTKYASEQDDELAAQLRAFLQTLSEWRRLAHRRPLAEVLWHIYDSTGYLAFCAGMQDGEQRVANLIDFHERTRHFGSFQRQGLARFMEFLDSLEEQSDLGQPSVASEADDVVRVMSIHRSKGLEFPVVIIPDLAKQHNLQDTHGSILVDRDAGIGLMVADETLRVRYPSLAHVLVQQRIKKQTLAEEMRVLYVAMTRAREHLILVGTCEEPVPQSWSEQWSHHSGPLPAERILGSKTMLDWIGPAAAAIAGSGAKDRIEVKWHNEAEVEQWSISAARRHPPSEEFEKLANLAPLNPTPVMHPDAAEVQKRLAFQYPYIAYTQLPAVQSVGALTKQGRAAPAGHSPSQKSIIPFESELAAPRFILEELTISPTDAGAATHLVLEHLDYARASDRADLRSQVAELLRKKLISAALAETVDLDSIVWLMSTDLGRLLQRNSKNLRRELPIYIARESDQAVPSSDPLDRVMVRGRVDVLIPGDDGLTIVDFKTDRVTSQTVDARLDFYRPQLAAYRDAIQSILNQPVRSVMLVFLAARTIREL